VFGDRLQHDRCYAYTPSLALQGLDQGTPDASAADGRVHIHPLDFGGRAGAQAGREFVDRGSHLRQVKIAQRADSKPGLRSAASIAPASLAGFFNGAVEYEEFPMISACLCWTVMGMIRRSWGWQNAATGKISATAIFIRTEVDARLALL
jgi:hypothetical protein